VTSFNALLDPPAIPRVLKVLLHGQTGTREDSVVEHLQERAYTTKAIEMLVGQGIIRRENGLLTIVEGEENSRRVSGILRFYDDLDRTVRRRLLFRGILNAANYAYLVHFKTFTTLMETDGFSPEDLNAVLDADGREGYVERLKVMYRAGEGLEHRRFPFIPLHHYPRFIIMKPDDTGHLRERLRSMGVMMIEEEYLLGRYPKEIARQSRDYMVREKEHIREKIKNEGFDVWWYCRF
jgi:hypothetical protein